MKYFNNVLDPVYMQVTLFAWLNSKIEKTSTKDKFENYGFFCTILLYVNAVYPSYRDTICSVKVYFNSDATWQVTHQYTVSCFLKLHRA